MLLSIFKLLPTIEITLIFNIHEDEEEAVTFYFIT